MSDLQQNLKLLEKIRSEKNRNVETELALTDDNRRIAIEEAAKRRINEDDNTTFGKGKTRGFFNTAIDVAANVPQDIMEKEFYLMLNLLKQKLMMH